MKALSFEDQGEQFLVSTDGDGEEAVSEEK
jgi:hypothetical protein